MSNFYHVEITIAKRQQKQLQKLQTRLENMCAYWGDYSGALEQDFERLIDQVKETKLSVTDNIKDWKIDGKNKPFGD